MLPERATRSTISRPCLLNLVRMVWKVLLGAGMSLLEPLRLAPLESLLPNGTSQLGPPVFSYKNKTNYNKHPISSLIKQKLYYAKTKAKDKRKKRMSYNDSGVSGSNGQNISTRNSLRTFFLQSRFDLINHFKSSSRVSVWI